MTLSDLLKAVPNIVDDSAVTSDPAITAPICEDSRAVQPGGLFVARRGKSTDGHIYIPAAVERGAAAVVGEYPPEQVSCPVPYVQVADGGLALAYLSAAFFGFPARQLVMIGVTGTDGKTTTTNLLFSILQTAGIPVGMISTINAVLGDQEVDTGLHVTTPAAPQVQEYLARMVRSGLTHCILETTSHGWAQHRVAACDFDVAIVTNIQHEHLDFHGTWEAYRDAKAMLFRDLMRGMRKTTGPAAGLPKTAVINLDDDPSAGYLLAIPADRYITYAIDPAKGAAVSAPQVEYGPDSTRLAISGPDGTTLAVSSALIGQYNVSNILAAVSAAIGLGVEPEAIRLGVEAVRGVPGRMERIHEGQPFLAVVDFAHTPNALEQALRAARLMVPPTGRIIAVWGSAGLRDPQKRALMGEVSARLADLTVITAEDPRTESLDEIMAASAEACRAMGGIEGETFWRVPDRGEAIYFATQMARPGDVVIAFGKGHEQSMCFGTVEYPWDDREAMRAALRGQPLRTLPTVSGRG
jgi:UDP-N-acetylmuramoyl-L-alanyl-D-glutamate--2,6-diaminopimelate ligase